MVTAEKDGKEIFAAPPNGAAFKVINEEGLIELRNKLRGTRSPVVRGLVYAEAGLLPEAEGEFRMYLESHANDKQVEELLRRVRSWHD